MRYVGFYETSGGNISHNVAVRVRAGIILVKDNAIAIIKSVRKTRTFYVLPGTAVEGHENTRQAVIRAARQELGVNIELSRLVAVVEITKADDHWLQLYYLVQPLANAASNLKAKALTARAASDEAIWMPLELLPSHKIHPKPLAALLAREIPKDVLHITETTARRKPKDKAPRVLETAP